MGQQGDYHWIEETPALCLADLIEHCPHVMLGRYLAAATFDSGSLGLNDEERRAGWTENDGVAYSPRLTALSELVCEQYDEWYLFSRPKLLGTFERFVNWHSFSLRDPESLLHEADPTWDRMGRQKAVNWLRELQQHFWAQIERIAPESYIADGDNLIFVTAEPQVYATVERWMRSSAPEQD